VKQKRESFASVHTFSFGGKLTRNNLNFYQEGERNKEAQKTNAFQANNNILLSDKASINTKPQLEIFADDVKCSHGCTIGQLDESAMFYMRSRGIPEKEAKALLMFAFSNTVLSSVKIPQLKQRITKIIAKKLGVNLGFDL